MEEYSIEKTEELFDEFSRLNKENSKSTEKMINLFEEIKKCDDRIKDE